MANRPTVPNWNTINLNKPNEYSSEFISGNSRYANVTDVSTGQRWLYSVGPIGTRTLISTTSPNGDVTKGPGFDAVSGQYSTLNTLNKNQSNYIIQRVSTTEEKTNIGKSSEYRSRFGNTSRSGISTTGITTSNVGISSYKPDYDNPIIPRGEIVTYPLKMRSEQDRIIFTAVEIVPRTDENLGNLGNIAGEEALEESFNAFQIEDPKYELIAGSVAMSIQSPIQEQSGVEWSQDSISALDALLYNAATALIGQGGNKNLKSPIENIGEQTKRAAQSNVGRIQRYFAGQAAGVNNIVARTDGVVLNPNLELVFQGPQLRPFSFTFKMSARSKEEGVAIKRIIKYFKRHMAVRKEKGIFIKAPHVFTIMYQKGTNSIHPSIGRISPDITKKACALTNCSVDYTPLGSYMTYNDNEGTMVAYTISLQFQEIQPIYDTDYKDNHPIGY